MNKIHSSDDLSNESNSKRKEVIFYELSSLTNVDSQNKMQTNKMKRIQQMKTIKDMNKTELIELVNDLQNEIQSLTESLFNKDELITELQIRLESSSKDGRKSQVLELLRKHHTISILEISKTLSISTKNVSSQLTYLRSDGYAIFTDPNGRKMLVEDNKVSDIQSTEDQSVNEDHEMNDDHSDNTDDQV